MSIEHIVLSGGGFAGLLELGALQHLSEIGFYDINNIKSIYGTSVGSIIGAVIALKLDWNIVTNYFTKRPFYKLPSFKMTPDKFIDFYQTSGIIKKTMIQDLLGYIFDYCELDNQITLKEFYEKTNINLYIYSTKLQGYELVEFSHYSHPDFSLFDALYCSSSIISLMVPFVKDDITYMDGGYIDNYPIEPCLERVNDIQSILSISFGRTFEQYGTANTDNNIINTILTFTLEMMKKSYKQSMCVVPNQVNMVIELKDIVSIETFYGTDEKSSLVQKGIDYAKLFIMYRNQFTQKRLQNQQD